MAVDWKARLLDQTTRASPAFPQVVRQVIQEAIAGGVPASEVKRFVAEHQDVFGDAAHEAGLQAAKKAAEALLDSTSPRLPASAHGSTPPGVKAHALRLDPGAATKTAWFQKATLPSLPPSLLTGTLKGKGDAVVVDGERFTASDVAALLLLAA